MPLLLAIALTTLTASSGNADPSQYRYRLPVRLPPTSELGFSLHLTPAERATLRSDLADLVLTDRDGRPVALTEATTSVEAVLAPNKPRRVGRAAVYELPLPASPLVLEELRFQIPDPPESFDRPFVLIGESEGKMVELSAGRLFRKPGTQVPLSFSVDPLTLTRLELRVEEGTSAAPLPIAEITARVRSNVLGLEAPPGDYMLWFGGPVVAPPRHVSAVRASAEATRGQLEPNPLHRVREEKRRLRFAHGVVGGLIVAALATQWIRIRRARRPA